MLLIELGLLPLLLTAVSAGSVGAVRRVHYPPLQRRLDFVGAAPLRAISCPSELQDCGSDAMKWCCPKTTECVRDFCCPTKSPCSALVITTPSCADPSHNLFTWTHSLWGERFFCCRPGELGYVASSGNAGDEACGKPPLGVASTLLATAVNPSATMNIDPGLADSTLTITKTVPPVATTLVITAADGQVHTITTTLSGSTVIEAATAAAGSGGKTTDGPGSSSGDEKSGLGTGAIVGIVVGVVGGLGLLVLAVWIGIRLGRKGAANGGGQMNLAAPQTYQTAPAPMYSAAVTPTAEKDAGYQVTRQPEELAGRELGR